MHIEVEQNGHDLESLRIARPIATPRRVPKPLAGTAMLALGLIVAGGASYLVYSRTSGRPQVVETFIVTTTGASQPGVMLTGSGYVVTRHKYITIGTKILGQIVSEPIEEGQHVKKGDVLAQIDDRDYQAQLRQAIAARDLAEANVRLTTSKAERSKQLIGTGAISKDEYETSINAAEVAQAQLKRDEAAVDYARFEVGQCVVTSPINGIVLKKYRELGDTINYGGQIQAGGGATDIAQLADTDDMRAEVDINESDIAKVTLGSPAMVVPDAYPERRFDASLVKVYPEADRQKGTVKIEVRIEHPDFQIIKPEMGVKVSFLASGQSVASGGRTVIPKKAIKTQGDKSHVWLMRNGVAQRASIERGRELETGTEITQGLKDGDVVVVSETAGLAEGKHIVTR
jgi:RND family efflux transporter MFP subunit